MTKGELNFWKFVSWDVTMTFDDAQRLAEQITLGTTRVNASSPGGRFYKLGGWCFDLPALASYKPYLVLYHYGDIQQAWGSSVAELREKLYLSPKDRVATNPFAGDAALIDESSEESFT